MTLNDKAKQARQAYLQGFLSHQDYYSWLAEEMHFGSGLVASVIGRDKIIKSTCPHFNDIPLRQWDVFHSYTTCCVPRPALSLSDSVCLAKALARRIRDASHQGASHV